MRVIKLLGGGAKALALQFVAPLAIVLVAVVAVHWIGTEFGLDLSGRQIGQMFLVGVVVVGALIGARRRQR